MSQTNITPEKIFQVGLGFWASKTLLSAIELRLFTRLAKGPLDAESIGSELKLHPRSRLDFLDALVALGFLERSSDNRYSNTADSDFFLDRNKPAYIGGILEMCNTRLYDFWGSLTEGLRTGEPQNEVKTQKSEQLFDTLYSDPERLKGFLKAMTGLSLSSGKAIAERFPWHKYKTFIDIGAAQGGVPVQIAKAHSHLTGGGFDLAPVRPIFEAYVAEHGLSDRLKFYEGSFLTDPLPRADVLVMGHILHDWNLEEKKMLLQKAFDALPAGGVLIVHEALIDDERRQNAFGLLMSLNMLIETPGGFDYTGADCQSWMKEVGFKETRVEHLLGPDSMAIAIK